jgi:rod shape-determining protein MreD
MTVAARVAFTRRPEVRWRWRIVVGGGVALAVLHAMALHRLGLEDFTPDVFTLFALFIGLHASREGRYTPSLVLGLVRDFFSLGLLGSYGVLYALLHKFAERSRARLDPDKPINTFIIAMIGVFLVNFGYHVMLALAGDGVGWQRALARCGATATATAPLAVLLFPLAHMVLSRLGVPRHGSHWAI